MKNMFVFISLFSVFMFSCDNNKFCENLRKIKVGMNTGQVLIAMGSIPDSTLVNYLANGQFSYMYRVPYGVSENVYINFSQKDSIVLSAYGCE